MTARERIEQERLIRDNAAIEVSLLAKKTTKAKELLSLVYAQSFCLLSATRNANSLITNANIQWPDGSLGIFTATTINTTFNTIDAYTVTYVTADYTLTFTQNAVTRDASGAVIAQPLITFI